MLCAVYNTVLGMLCRQHLLLVFREDDGGIDLLGQGLEDHTGLGGGLTDYHGHTILDNTGLLHRDLLQRGAEELGVVETDVRDDG